MILLEHEPTIIDYNGLENLDRYIRWNFGGAMPLVIVNRNPYKMYGEALDYLNQELPRIVAENLGIPGAKGALNYHDIEVWVRDQRRDDKDTLFDLEIIIFANQYPERLQNLEERREKIGKSVRHILSLKKCDNVRCYVWVLLAPGSFGEC